jgi:hypothetical protein
MMTVVFEKEVLISALIPALGAVSTRNTVPAIEGILMDCRNEGKCILSAYDMDKGMRTVINAEIEEFGACIIHAQKLLQNFLRRLKRRCTGLKYVYILEKGQENGRLHIHMVISGGMDEENLAALWAMGKVKAAALEFNEDGLAALAKYFTKGDSDNGSKPITWKRWVASRNLEKPVVEEHDRRLPHYKMAALCQDGGDTDYLETEYCGYEIAPYSVAVAQDIYGGYYLAAVLKKMPPRTDAWTEIWGLPF